MHRPSFTLVLYLHLSLVLTYEVRSEVARIEGGTGERGEPEVREEVRTVRLGPEGFAVRVGSSTRLYDLAGRRSIVLDAEGRTWVETPLVASVEFRTAELRNRLGLRHVLDSAGVEGKRNPFERFGIESELGVEAPGGPAVRIEERREGSDRVYLAGEDEAARVAEGEVDLAPVLQATFRRYLAHELPLHPRIRRSIAELPGLPRPDFFLPRRADRDE